jgi:hypothetical protein
MTGRTVSVVDGEFVDIDLFSEDFVSRIIASLEGLPNID